MSIYSKLAMTASTPSTRFYTSAVGLGLDPTGAHFGMAPLKCVDINFSLFFFSDFSNSSCAHVSIRLISLTEIIFAVLALFVSIHGCHVAWVPFELSGWPMAMGVNWLTLGGAKRIGFCAFQVMSFGCFLAIELLWCLFWVTRFQIFGP